MKDNKIKRPDDLAPRGVRSTYQSDRTDFNSTWITIYNNIRYGRDAN